MTLFHGQKLTPNFTQVIHILPYYTILYSKGNKILLSLAPILMQTILAPIFTDFFLTYIFLFDANEKYVFLFWNFFPFIKTLKGRRPNLCQLVAYAGPL